jgi:hypothetical protein
MGPLTPRQALENLIRNDRRNLGAIRSDTSVETVSRVVADCAVRLFEARELRDDVLVRGAEHNLRLAADAWKARRV